MTRARTQLRIVSRSRPNVLAWYAATEVSRHPGLGPVRLLEKGRFKLIRPPPSGYITRFVGIGWEKRPAGVISSAGAPGAGGNAKRRLRLPEPPLAVVR